MTIKHLTLFIALVLGLMGVSVYAYLSTIKDQNKAAVLTCPDGSALQNTVSWWNPIPGVVGPSAIYQASLNGHEAKGRLNLAIDSSNSRMPLYARLAPHPTAVVCRIEGVPQVTTVAACRYKVVASYPAYASTDGFPFHGCKDILSTDGYVNLILLISHEVCSSQGNAIICKPQPNSPNFA